MAPSFKKPIAIGDEIEYRYYSYSERPVTFVWKKGTVLDLCNDVAVIDPGGRGMKGAIPRDWIRSIVTDADTINHLIDKLKLIAIQHQAFAGNTTPEEAWRGAQTIARDTLAELGVQV